MDIAKIRKKAQERQAGRSPAEVPAPQPARTEEPAGPEPTAAAGEEPQEAEEAGRGAERKEAAVQEPLKAPAAAGEAGAEAEEVPLELLTFSLGSEEFAFKVDEVEEILRYQKITKVPTLPGYVIGITSLRGKIIPVLELKLRLNLKPEGEVSGTASGEPESSDRESKILIVDGPQGFIGATIDRVIGVVSLDRNRVLEPPAHLTEAEMKYIEGVVILEKRFISVLRASDTMNVEIG